METSLINLKEDGIELRPIQLVYAEELFLLTDKNRNYLRQWLPWLDYTKSIEDTSNFIKTSLDQFLKKEGVQFCIFFEEKLVGMIGYHAMNNSDRRASIGYWIDENYQGRGIMTVACKLLLDYGFNQLNLNRIDLSCATGNAKSCAIPKRLGFTKEGIMRQAEWLYDHFVDLEHYSLLASEWNELG